MKKSVNGSAVAPVVIGIAFALGAVVGAGGMYLLGRNPGGLGNGKDMAIQVNENISVPEEIPETSDIPETSESETEMETESQSEPVTEHGDYLVISVIGNEYYCDHQAYTLEDILSILHHSEELPSVMLVNDKASKKAYDTLSTALQNENIHLIRTEETKPES